MQPLRVLAVGDLRHREFAEPREVIEATSELVAVAEVSAALAMLAASGDAPDVIVLAQQWPGQFQLAQVDALRRSAPLARPVALLGSWCEGETRTGRPWPAVTRVFWYQWATWWPRQAERHQRGQCPSWGLPVTATLEDHAEAAPRGAEETRQGLVAVHTPHRETAESLGDALCQRGYAADWIVPRETVRLRGVAAILWDGKLYDDRELAAIGRLRNKLQGAAVVALADFPRIDLARKLSRAGAGFVVGRPFSLDELFGRLDQAIAGRLCPV